MNMDLNKLSGLNAPKPSVDRKADTLASAMAAFDEAKKNENHAQGLAGRRRQSSIINTLWSNVMNRKLLAGSALATLLVVPAAGFITMEITRGKMAGYSTEELAEQKKLPASGTVTATEPGKKVAEIAGRIESDPTTADTPDGGENAPARLAKQNETASADTRNAAARIGADKKEIASLHSEPAPAEKTTDDAGIAAPAVKDGLVAAGQAQSSTTTEEQSMVLDSPQDDESVVELAPAQSEAQPLIAGSDRARRVLQSDKLDGSLTVDTLRRQTEIVPVEKQKGDKFSSDNINPVKSVATEPVSTFSIDVDTASYAYMRRSLTEGQLPDPASVRVEEMINYFPYDWKPPESADQAFKANVTVMPTPWNEHTRLMHIGIKGYDLALAQQPSANLVFLIDVSGSMNEPDKLPLLKSAFRLLVGRMKPTDTVSIVTYAGNSGVVLEPTKAIDRDKILAAIDNLQPGGSTAGAEGIATAYQLAKKAFIKDGVNRVLLATDGDFNVGPSSDGELKKIIEDKRKSGIFLSVLGFGSGNYNDALMQTLAQNGNGTAAYIDTLSEAQKTLVEEAGSSLFPIAKDVKIQVEFNPARIAEYRLIGYETRALNREDFNNDRIDAGEIGSGHRVTAIYEVTPKGSPAMVNDDLRYGAPDPQAAASQVAPDKATDELAFVKIRYKKPDEDKSTLVTMPVTEAQAVDSVDATSQDVRFSVAVAAFGQKLKGEDPVADFNYQRIIDMATKARGEDTFGYRAEFVNLVRLAQGLTGE